ncbi:MAG: hypothetical protein EP343_17965 [Deltaproteobacteria bacterium]|nr:MAG: hypothetical protein EP343_17965 [Deltaproteobacteria bacterium]
MEHVVLARTLCAVQTVAAHQARLVVQEVPAMFQVGEVVETLVLPQNLLSAVVVGAVRKVTLFVVQIIAVGRALNAQVQVARLPTLVVRRELTDVVLQAVLQMEKFVVPMLAFPQSTATLVMFAKQMGVMRAVGEVVLAVGAVGLAHRLIRSLAPARAVAPKITPPVVVTDVVALLLPVKMVLVFLTRLQIMEVVPPVTGMIATQGEAVEEQLTRCRTCTVVAKAPKGSSQVR